MENLTTAEQIAIVIKRYVSPAELERAAQAMGAEILPGEDVFQALLRAGRASDLDTAVIIVVAYLNKSSVHLDQALTFPATSQPVLS